MGIARDHSDLVGFSIWIGLVFSCVAMALGYLVAYVFAEFLAGLLGGKKESA